MQAIGYNGWSPLHYASRFGSIEVTKVCRRSDSLFAEARLPIQVLLDRGANTEAIDKEKWTPLHHAAYAARVEIIKVHRRDLSKSYV